MVQVTVCHPRLNLLSALNDLTHKEKQNVLKAVFAAVKYCHCRAIVLCTLNPDAIKLMLDTRRSNQVPAQKADDVERSFFVQIVDLTCSVRLNENPTVGQLQRRSVWGHYLSHYEHYIAPELKKDGPALQEVITPAVDVWSVGMIGAVIMHGAIPTTAEQIDSSLEVSKSHLRVISQWRARPKSEFMIARQASSVF